MNGVAGSVISIQDMSLCVVACLIVDHFHLTGRSRTTFTKLNVESVGRRYKAANAEHDVMELNDVHQGQ